MTKTLLIMPTYNGTKHLKGQLDSIRNQEHALDQVIFRDDASTDGTVDFLKSHISNHQLKNWEIRENEKNIGWRRNFRQLLIDAQDYNPEFVFFADQDDIWQTDKNSCQLEIMEENPEIDLLSADMEVVKTSREVTENHYHKFSDGDQRLSKFPERVRYKSFRPGWTLLVRNRLIKEVLQYWPEDVVVNHDALLEDLACLLGTGYNLNQIVGQHLRHDTNASGKAIISLASTRQEHIKALYDYQGFFQIIYEVLKDREAKAAVRVLEEADFYQRRYQAAKTEKKLIIFRQLLRDWSGYEAMSGRIRDVIFAFKK